MSSGGANMMNQLELQESQRQPLYLDPQRNEHLNQKRNEISFRIVLLIMGCVIISILFGMFLSQPSTNELKAQIQKLEEELKEEKKLEKEEIQRLKEKVALESQKNFLQLKHNLEISEFQLKKLQEKSQEQSNSQEILHYTQSQPHPTTKMQAQLKNDEEMQQPSKSDEKEQSQQESKSDEKQQSQQELKSKEKKQMQQQLESAEKIQQQQQSKIQEEDQQQESKIQEEDQQQESKIKKEEDQRQESKGEEKEQMQQSKNDEKEQQQQQSKSQEKQQMQQQSKDDQKVQQPLKSDEKVSWHSKDDEKGQQSLKSDEKVSQQSKDDQKMQQSLKSDEKASYQSKDDQKGQQPLKSNVEKKRNIHKVPKKSAVQQFLQYHIEEKKIKNEYVESLVMNFTGEVTTPPILTLSNPSKLSKYYDSFQNKRDYAVDLFKKEDSKLVQQVEYYQLNKRYSIGQYEKELPICLIAPGRDIVSKHVYLRFLKSIEHQNYTNYRVVLIDDDSTDNSAQILKKEISKLPRLRARTTLIKNYQRIGALGNKFLAITNHCQKGSIVIDVDADDALIGRQVMKLMNALYQSSDNWFIYSNHVLNKTYRIHDGLSKEIDPKVLAKNGYRTSEKWITSHLRTYLRDLYVKIPKQYFLEQKYKFYFRVSDLFQLFALIELASNGHVQHISDSLYWYQYFDSHLPKKQCAMRKVQFYSEIARKQTPLMPLKSLDEKARKTPNYVVPKRVINKFNKKSARYQKCKEENQNAQ